MALKLWIQAPTLTGGPLTLYETGMSGGLLYPDRLSSITRKVDVYTGRDSIASAGTLTTALDNRDGLFSPDGVFAQDWRAVAIVAAIDDRVVFVGRPEKTTEGVAGIRADIQWRDAVDDFLAQQVPGVESEDEDAGQIIAQTSLVGTLASLGLATAGVTDLTLWLPENATTLRRWLFPVLAVLGFSIDWTSTLNAAGEVIAGFRVQTEAEFGNEADIPSFIDKHLVGDASWDSGRDQVFNIWTGRRRYWDREARKFETEDIECRGLYSMGSGPAASRVLYGERKGRFDMSMVRAERHAVRATIDAAIRKRWWPHQRATLTLSGPEAAALRIGDGFITSFNLGIAQGRGLARTWRVIGRTVDLLNEITKIYCEARDARDEDFSSWVAAGANTTDAA